MTFTIDNFGFDKYFFSDKHICREERQYALFLYNIFLKKLYIDKKVGDYKLDSQEEEIIKKCLDLKCVNGIKLINVFYEFSALRDLFAEADDRVKFNKNLLNSIFKILEIEDIEKVEDSLTQYKNKHNSKNCSLYDNLGRLNMNFFKIEWDFSEDALKTIYLIRCMLNSKADIVVLYEEDSKIKVKALECKYKSGEGMYKGLHDIYKSIDALAQTEVQTIVLKYLFKEFVDDYANKIIQFVDEDNKKNNKDNSVVISIKCLDSLR